MSATLWPAIVKVKGGQPVAQPYSYRWGDMLVGTSKVCASPIDAVLEVLMFELKITKKEYLYVDLGIPTASVSRIRHRKDHIPHLWLLRASVLSNIPYGVLCKVAGEEPEYTVHHNAKEWKA